MLLSESEGDFSYEEWNEACQTAEEACYGGDDDDDDEGGIKLDVEGEAMDVDVQIEPENLDRWLRSVVKSKVEHEQRWKSAA